MNLARLSTGTKVLLAAGILLFVDSWLSWQKACVSFGGSEVCGSENMWQGIGVIAGILVIALIVWEGLQIAGVLDQVELPFTAALVSVGLAGATALFTLIKWAAVLGDFSTIWAWIGAILALAIAVGGFLKFSEAGAPAQATAPPPAAPPPPAPPA